MSLRYFPDVASLNVQPPCYGCYENILHLIESEMDLGNFVTALNILNMPSYLHVSTAQIEKYGQIEQEATEKTTCQTSSVHLLR